MKFLNHIKRLCLPAFALLCMLGAGILLSSCDDDEGGTGDARLNSFGPSPVMRGGQLRFIGTNLDKVTAIVLPGNTEVTTFITKSPGLIVIEVPESAMRGYVTIKTPKGDLVTKTELGIAEPVTITSVSPAAVRPGATLTIEGTYLNLVKEVIFTNNKSVTEFESQSQSSLSLIVPEDAETGAFILSDGEEIPNMIESEVVLQVILPAGTGIGPDPVKAGEELTITGSDLDLVKDVTFKGGARITSDLFVSQTGEEVVLVVPDNAQDGAVVLRPASAVEVEVSESLALVAPGITNFTPNPGKNSSILTITGTDLDLVTAVVFGGDKEGEIQDGRTATEIAVKIPADATEGALTFNTQNKPVTTETELSLMVPTITGIAPLSVNTASNPTITITGTNLDLAKTIVFGGENWIADITKATVATATEIQIPVTPGSVSGNIKVMTTNGEEITSGQSLTIVPDVPDVNAPAQALIGTYLTLTGTNMNVPAQVIFPGNVIATNFGSKTATEIEVFVPLTITPGEGSITFITSKNEIYESAAINFRFAGAEPIADPALLLYNFDAEALRGQWADAGAVQDGSHDGTKFFKINQNRNGWAVLFMRNAEWPAAVSAIGANAQDYVIKFDVKINKAFTGGNLKIRLNGPQGDHWWAWGPAAPTSGNFPLTANPTPGWITVTVPISDFRLNYGWDPGNLTDLTSMNEWGMVWDNGQSDVDIEVDNVRFELAE